MPKLSIQEFEKKYKDYHEICLFQSVPDIADMIHGDWADRYEVLDNKTLTKDSVIFVFLTLANKEDMDLLQLSFEYSSEWKINHDQDA